MAVKRKKLPGVPRMSQVNQASFSILYDWAYQSITDEELTIDSPFVLTRDCYIDLKTVDPFFAENFDVIVLA